MNQRSIIKPGTRKRVGRRKASKSKILKIALGLFSSKGYSETKMTEIARGAGISVGALYLQFRNKEELCLELIKDQTKDYFDITEKLASSEREPLRALKDYISFCLEHAFKRKQLISMFYREHRLPFLQPMTKTFFKTQHRLIQDILNSGMEDGSIKRLDAHNTALMIFASIRGAVIVKLIFGAGTSKALGESLFDLISNGIGKEVS
jgi:AcrR family transcriptional regulator